MRRLFSSKISYYKVLMISQLRHEASLTITTLNQKFGDNFVPTFITRVDEPLHMFDYVFKCVSPQVIVESCKY